jgi:hypothetical protein
MIIITACVIRRMNGKNQNATGIDSKMCRKKEMERFILLSFSVTVEA